MINTPHPPQIVPVSREVRRAFLRVWDDVKSRPRYARVRVVRDVSRVEAGRDRQVCFVAPVESVTDDFAAQVRDVSHRVQQTAFLLVAGPGVACEAIPEHTVRLRAQDPERVQLVRAGEGGELRAVFRRFLSTLTADEPRERIFGAWWEGETLVVCSPRFNRLHVPRASLPVLEQASAAALARFEVDEDGSFVFWPELDVHLGWQQLLEAIDPGASLRASQRRGEFNARYGAALRAVRKRTGLRQTDVPGLTPRHLGRIERGECRATLKALRTLARAHGRTLDAYLRELAEALRSPA